MELFKLPAVITLAILYFSQYSVAHFINIEKDKISVVKICLKEYDATVVFKPGVSIAFLIKAKSRNRKGPDHT